MKIKVIVIDAQNEILYSTFIENTLKEFKNIIESFGIERVPLSGKESLFIDNEGLFTTKAAFSLDRGLNLNQYCLPYFAGNGIIAGVAEDGTLTDCISDTEHILQGLQFFEIDADYIK